MSSVPQFLLMWNGNDNCSYFLGLWGGLKNPLPVKHRWQWGLFNCSHYFCHTLPGYANGWAGHHTSSLLGLSPVLGEAENVLNASGYGDGPGGAGVWAAQNRVASSSWSGPSQAAEIPAPGQSCQRREILHACQLQPVSPGEAGDPHLTWFSGKKYHL